MARQIKAVILSIGLAVVAPAALAAELGDKKFENYSDMHLRSDYGTLFFAERAAENSADKYSSFTLIIGDGELNLPAKDSYCFVLNHYSLPKGFQNRLHTYRTKTIKWRGEKQQKTESFRETYIPTAEESSKQVPDYCVSGIKDVTTIAIEFGSDDGMFFNHKISFKLK